MIYLLLVLLFKVIQWYSYLLLAYALLSWFPGAYDSWIGRLLIQVVEPVVGPFRKLNLQFAGFDFTIFAVMLALNILSRVLIAIFF